MILRHKYGACFEDFKIISGNWFILRQSVALSMFWTSLFLQASF